MTDAPEVAAVRRWLSDVVIGLNLCPFAGHPTSEGRVRFQVSQAKKQKALLAELQAELALLESTPAATLETTLLIVPHLLADFLDYNDFLDRAEVLIARGGWQGTFQVASFHPHYQFANTEPTDAENLTNRAPYPILHLLREASIDQAVDFYPDIDQIPESNILRMNALTDEQKQRLFPYLF